MFLIRKGKKPKPICSRHRRVFAGKRCPECIAAAIREKRRLDRFARDMRFIREQLERQA